MNEAQLARAARIAEMRERQKLLKPRGRRPIQEAKVVLGKTPGGPRWGDRDRNQFHRRVEGSLFAHGAFKVEHIRNGEVIGEYAMPNGIVNEGLNRVLNTMFNAGTQNTSWFAGLIDNTGFTALADDDIYDDINQAGNGWDEFDDYTDANNSDSAVTRPEWPADNASGQSITNSVQAIYDITASGTVKGIFIVAGTNAQTKGDHTAGSAHVLWSTALFTGGNVTVSNGDQLKVTYTVNASSA